MSSQHHPRSNRLSESATKTIKQLFKKASNAGEYIFIYLAFLNFRNTSRSQIHSSVSNQMDRKHVHIVL